MFMRLLRWPKPHALLVDMPTQMKSGFVTKQDQSKFLWVVLNSFTYDLTNFTPFFFYWLKFVFRGFALCIEITLSHCDLSLLTVVLKM